MNQSAVYSGNIGSKKAPLSPDIGRLCQFKAPDMGKALNIGEILIFFLAGFDGDLRRDKGVNGLPCLILRDVAILIQSGLAKAT